MCLCKQKEREEQENLRRIEALLEVLRLGAGRACRAKQMANRQGVLTVIRDHFLWQLCFTCFVFDLEYILQSPAGPAPLQYPLPNSCLQNRCQGVAGARPSLLIHSPSSSSRGCGYYGVDRLCLCHVPPSSSKLVFGLRHLTSAPWRDSVMNRLLNMLKGVAGLKE
jgi:hypothetical protein